MGRLIAGMLVALFATFALAGPARAAEIPPTTTCQKVLVAEFNKYLESGGLFDSKAKEERAGKRMNRNLYKAGCVSDPKPLNDWLKPDPFSQQCLDASSAARSFFAPIGDRLVRLDQRYKARERNLNRKVRKLNSRIRQLRRAGVPARKLKRLTRKRAMLQVSSFVLGLELFLKQVETVSPQSAAVSLSTLELVSLRCIGGRNFRAVTLENEKVGEPAAKALHRYQRVVAYSLFVLFFGPEEGASASASSFTRPTVGQTPPSLEENSGPLADLLALAFTS